MDGFIKNPTRKCPEENANFLSKLFFWWMRKFFALGAQKDLELRDLFRPLQSDESARVTDKLERAWRKEEEKINILQYLPDSKQRCVTSAKPSLLHAIFVVFWWDYLKVGIPMLIMGAVLHTLQPLLLRQILRHFSASGFETVVDEQTALYYTTGLIINLMIIVAFNHHSLLAAQRVAMRIRVACSSLAYRKILRLSQSVLTSRTPGQIVDILSNDVGRIDVLAALFNSLWITPIQIFAIGSVMYVLIGPAAFVGLSTLVLLIGPVQFVVNKCSKRWRHKIAALTDRRMQIMSELVNSIQVVKMYAWETPFTNAVSRARAAEMKAIRRTTYLRSFNFGVSTFASKLNLFLTLLVYVLQGNNITAEVAFTVGLYFYILQSSAAFSFPQATMKASEAAVSIKRLQDFLLLDELRVENQLTEEKKDHNTSYVSDGSIASILSVEHLPRINESTENEESLSAETEDPRADGAVFVELQHISANWNVGHLPPTFCDISLKIYGGELCALVGLSGAGKSSILNLLLKELPIGSGNLYLRQGFRDFEEFLSRCGYVTDNPKLVISYASQEPWIFAGTFRDNILFGQAYDAVRYHEVTKVCALWRDMRLWPQGDLTVVGERGVALSGGQKARVNLARAVYKRADLYLLDDPLSAMDPRIARRLFKKCINGFLKGKTRILVTHQLQFLKHTDTIVVLDRGLMKVQGTFHDLSRSSNDFTSILSILKISDEAREKEAQEDVSAETGVERSTIEHADNLQRRDSVGSIDSLTLSIDHSSESRASSRGSIQPPEFFLKRNMSIAIWSRYFRAGGSLFVIILLLLIIVMAQLALTGTDVWVSYWCNLEAVRSSLISSDAKVTVNEYDSLVNATIFSQFGLLDEDGLLPRASAINIYASLVLAAVFLSFGRSLILFAVCLRVSDNLHNSMLRSVLHATMRFFNANASGRILSRFSRDVGTTDELLPRALLDALNIILLMISVFLALIVIIPWLIIPTILLISAFFFLTRCYLKTAYNIRRIEDVCKSPALSQVNATLQGIATIRSNGPDASRALRKQFDVCQDVHSGAWYMSIVATASFSFWLDLFVSMFVACVCYILVLLDDGETFAGTAGFVVCQALQLTGLLQFGVKQGADACSFATAVERILQFADVKPEGSATSKNPPPSNWPTRGRISMKNVYLSYSDDEFPVLKRLNLTIESGWKVGVIGRTGAGKTSLISALFRLENEGLEGEIKIDGRDIQTLGLQDLRSRISLIPEESVLFSGTLRYNLDPFNFYEDEKLLDALRDVELSGLSLDDDVSEGGRNFSIDQRLLVCLARAVLKNNQILVLEETTANVDAHTDELIRKTLKTKFVRHTVITVAHRLVTVIKSDRIILMDEGEIKEFGCPYELICDNPDGRFAEMVRETGPVEAENLTQLAEAACLRMPPQHSLDLVSSGSDEHPLPIECRK